MATWTESKAEFAVMQEWYAWNPTHVEKTAVNGIFFYCHLLRHKPWLLDFEAYGDKWQHVHCWLLRAGCVKD